jgi:hypothetical protein
MMASPAPSRIHWDMARRNSTELAAIPIILVGLGALFAVLYAANAGPIVFIIVGSVALAAVVALAVMLARRTNRDDAFEGAAAPATDGLHRVLVVTDGPWLVRDVQEISPRGFDPRSSVYVVAPPMSSGLDRWSGNEESYAQASEDLGATLDALTRLGVQAEGKVGAHDPIQAADETLREFPADEILFIVGQKRSTSWQEHSVVEAARGRYPVPVHESNGLRAG